jgi:2-dehydro-3-deoxyphosphooctonate aldolase (KDO 8-P synthase)
MASSILKLNEYFNNRMPVISGPCAVESEAICMQVAEQMVQIGQALNLPVVFKASYKKANRTSAHTFKGIEFEEAIAILLKVKEVFKIPVLTDVHETKEVEKVAEVADILQIPAFLCRQTELIQAAAATYKPVNIKKGQFASVNTMKNAIEKAAVMGNNQVMLTERGSFFGYEDLVVDMRNIPLMKNLNVPVIYDVTHSVQQPGKGGHFTGGLRQMITPLCDAALAAGADGIFVETHPDPASALSDGTTMLPLHELRAFVERALSWWELKKLLN